MTDQNNSTLEINALEEQYYKLMERVPDNSICNSEWEKEGDIYKFYNLHDTSKYETILSANTRLMNN